MREDGGSVPRRKILVLRTRSFLTVSALTAAALLLSGCTGSGNGADASETPGADLCSAAAAPGEQSDSVTVSGAVGEEPTVTFPMPMEITEMERTVIEEGAGDPIAAGDLVSYGVSAYDAATGDVLGGGGFTAEDPILPQQVSADSSIAQILGCAAPGSRFAVTFPASNSSQAAVYVVDLLGVVPGKAWGEPAEPVAGMPEVSLDDDGAPTVTLPEGDIPTAFAKATLAVGDGTVVEPGDSVLVQYQGTSWNTGEIFDQSWGAQPFTFTTDGVVPGFADAVIGETVGSQVIAVLPPAVAYGEGEITDADLTGQTLVFVVDILAAQHNG